MKVKTLAGAMQCPECGVPCKTLNAVGLSGPSGVVVLSEPCGHEWEYASATRLLTSQRPS